MPVLAFNKPVRSGVPELLVENTFEPGSYRFQLVVVDESGNESVPNDLVVQVRPARQPVERESLADRILEGIRGRISPFLPGG